ncbi:hypothetical protein [Paenibacillus agilis]|uniref:WRKY domain-containing protein n=1 Tax=Paenibacillus agilis TaxID=3020863 RepID=A0A559IZH8_9BACL|nr:hypothetical protein [Paenibacillus agilis]TVX93024.1 hypothetical protein FPZ44_08115 [Paenibacillus agilis]
MNWIKVKVNTGKARGEVEMKGATPEDVRGIVSKLFSVFENPTEQLKEPTMIVVNNAASATALSEERVIPINNIPISLRNELSMSMKDVLTAIEVTGGKIKPPLINSERTLGVTVGEKLAAAVEENGEEPKWYKTGIKYKDGVPHYRCVYFCKNKSCNKKKGQHYITPSETYVECYDCGQFMKVRQATDVHLERDEWGNFFVADRLAGG